METVDIIAEAGAGCVQQELDLAGDRLETIWNRRTQEEAANWTEEALCLQWLCPQSPPDWEWWRGLRQFERNTWLLDYRCGRDQVENGGRMPVAAVLAADRQVRWEQAKLLAQCWAEDIRQAFKERRPCPISPSFGFEVVLDMAIDIAGIPKECLQAEKADANAESEVA
jgi:hypothetical protein